MKLARIAFRVPPMMAPLLTLRAFAPVPFTMAAAIMSTTFAIKIADLFPQALTLWGTCLRTRDTHIHINCSLPHQTTCVVVPIS